MAERRESRCLYCQEVFPDDVLRLYAGYCCPEHAEAHGEEVSASPGRRREEGTCLWCGAALPLLARLKGDRFCSAEHEQQHYRKQAESILERVRRYQRRGGGSRLRSETAKVTIRPPQSRDGRGGVRDEWPLPHPELQWRNLRPAPPPVGPDLGLKSGGSIARTGKLTAYTFWREGQSGSRRPPSAGWRHREEPQHRLPLVTVHRGCGLPRLNPLAPVSIRGYHASHGMDAMAAPQRRSSWRAWQAGQRESVSAPSSGLHGNPAGFRPLRQWLSVPPRRLSPAAPPAALETWMETMPAAAWQVSAGTRAIRRSCRSPLREAPPEMKRPDRFASPGSLPFETGWRTAGSAVEAGGQGVWPRSPGAPGATRWLPQWPRRTRDALLIGIDRSAPACGAAPGSGCRGWAATGCEDTMKTSPNAPTAPAASPTLFARSRTVALRRPDRICSSSAVPEPAPPARPSWSAAPAGRPVWRSQEDQQGRAALRVSFSRALPAAGRLLRMPLLPEASPAPAPAERRAPVQEAYSQPKVAVVLAAPAHRASAPACAPQGLALRRQGPLLAVVQGRARDRAWDLPVRPAEEWLSAAAALCLPAPPQNLCLVQKDWFWPGAALAPEAPGRIAPPSFRTGEPVYVWIPEIAVPSGRAGHGAAHGLKRLAWLGACGQRAREESSFAAAVGLPQAGWAGSVAAPEFSKRIAPVFARGWKPRCAVGMWTVPGRFLSPAIGLNPALWRSRETGQLRIAVERGRMRPVASGLHRRLLIGDRPAHEIAADWNSLIVGHPLRLKLPHLVCRFPRPDWTGGIGKGGGGMSFFHSAGGS